MASVKREGWELTTTSIAPPKLFTGERHLGIAGFAVTGFVCMFLAPRVAGPLQLIVFLSGIAFWLVWTALLAFLWHVDPWLSKTLPRFLAYPKYMPSHSTTAASVRKRHALRSKGFLR